MLILFQNDIQLKDSKSACMQRIALYKINNQSVFNSMWPIMISQTELIPCNWFNYLCMGSLDDALCDSFVSIVMDIRKEIKLLQWLLRVLCACVCVRVCVIIRYYWWWCLIFLQIPPVFPGLPQSVVRFKHMKGSKERYLLRQNATLEFSG